MWALFVRELNGFFNSLIAYVVIAAFLLIIGLFLWIFPADFNIIEAGYANPEGLFVLAPFVFIFLIPAITMRFFADEKRSGTIEMLLTKPVTGFEVVLAKYLAGIVLMTVSVAPTLIYVITVSVFAQPPGVDMGGVWGSYAGLLFLGMVFVAIGLFASSLTENQIVAFIIALFLSGFFFIGFEMLHTLEMPGQMNLFIRDLGLFSHYSSMGRGVIDSRDVLYFLGVIALFLTLAQIQITIHTHAGHAWRRFIIVAAGVIVINIAGNMQYGRWDLTSEKRFSITAATKKVLRNLDDIVYFRVYLDGNLPAEFRRLRNDVREMLDEFRAYSDRVQFEFIDIAAQTGDDPEALRQYYRMLSEKGLEPAQIQMRAGDGTSQRVIFPGALVSFKEKEIPLHLLQDHIGLPIREILHLSSTALEYNLISAIHRLSIAEKERIAFLAGHGTLDPDYLFSITRELRQYYEVERVNIGEDFENIRDFRTLIVAGPREPFTEKEKFLLDQFLMGGGSMLWLVDPVFADMDSLAYAPETIGLAWDINMDDFFFRYGARLNPVLIKDLNAAPHPFTTGMVAGSPQINVLPWYYFPVITPVAEHKIVKNLNVIRTEFVSSIDTVEAPGVNKHILLQTSRYSRVMPVPVLISLEILQYGADEALFTGPPQTLAVLLEGRFESLFRNRIKPDVNLPEGFVVRDTGEPAAIILMADGSVIKNQFGRDGRPLPLGYDRVTGHTFGNKDFILNAVNYLTDDSGILEARAREIRLRLLDERRVNQHRSSIQILNTGLPVLVVMIFGALRVLLRKRKYSR